MNIRPLSIGHQVFRQTIGQKPPSGPGDKRGTPDIHQLRIFGTPRPFENLATEFQPCKVRSIKAAKAPQEFFSGPGPVIQYFFLPGYERILEIRP